MEARKFLKKGVFLLMLTVMIFSISAGVWADDEKEKGKKKEEKGVIVIKKAEWKKGALKVEGELRWPFFTVYVSDDETGAELGKTTSDFKGKWKISINGLETPPCRVKAEVEGGSVTAEVKGAKDTCGASTEPPSTGEPPSNGGTPLTGEFRVLAFNDLGMHCYDADFSVFSILPPFNVIHAQVVKTGKEPEIMDDSRVSVYYRAVSDSDGSINTTSRGKTNFWDYVLQLFGASPAEDEGLTGNSMPGSDNTPQPFDSYDPDMGWFTASGIPITAVDDGGKKNHYPMMRIQAVDKADGRVLAETDIVLPVSDEMHCSDCHSTGGVAANDQTRNRYGISGWSTSGDPEVSYRENILILHDAKKGTSLMNNQPVLCVSCHYSPALDLAGQGPVGEQVGKPMLSFAVHGRHGKTLNGDIPSNGKGAIIPEDGTTSCYYCHPGSTTKCLRGAMGSAGVNCQDCHGGLLAVAGEFRNRTPWLDEPKCQSCHTGDAISNSGSIRMGVAYDGNDPAATPRTPDNKRFAENSGELFRNSFGHGGVACEGCHGSTHAIWPSAEENDNVASTMIQGHDGVIIECSACHQDQLPLTMDGPHGMHNVGDPGWNEEHEDFYKKNPDSCKACHGDDLNGTVLSVAHADRELKTDDGGKGIFIPKGTSIGCGICHKNPLTGKRQPIEPPTNPVNPGNPGQPPSQPGIDGALLYSQNCAVCHGPLTSSSKRGASLSKIQNGIAKNKGGMGKLSFLTVEELQAIADALNF